MNELTLPGPLRNVQIDAFPLYSTAGYVSVILITQEKGKKTSMRVLQHATEVVDANTLGTIKAFSTALDLRLCYEEVVLDRDVASDFALLFNVALMALRDCTTEDLGSPTTLLTEAAKKAQTFCARTAEFATTLMVENLQEIFRVHPEHRELFEQVFVPRFTPSVLSQLKRP